MDRGERFKKTLCDTCKHREYLFVVEKNTSHIDDAYCIVDRCGIFKDVPASKLKKVVDCNRYERKDISVFPVNKPELEEPFVSGISSIKQDIKKGRFVVADSNVIKDTKTGLEWYVGPDEDIDHYGAERWANSLNVAGCGWLLPSIEELRGIYDKDKRSGADNNMRIDPVFFLDWKYASVWSRELLDENNNPSKNRKSPRARTFNFNTGNDGWYPRNAPYDGRVFAVRSGRRG